MAENVSQILWRKAQSQTPQITKSAKYLVHLSYGGREESLKAQAQALATNSAEKVEEVGRATLAEGKQVVADIKEKVGK